MSELFERLVRARGISEEFLNPKYKDCVSPSVLPDYKKAMDRIKKAVREGEKVLIYGDYDVDGVTASVVMADGLEMIGLEKVEIMLPDRFADGYGMSKKVIQKAKEIGASLVVTVDCGSGNGEVISELKKEGIDTIVTDHHECPEKMPSDAIAVVNPKRKDVQDCVEDWEKHMEELIEMRDLAGVGVAFTVIRGLVEEGLIEKGREKWLLDLVLIGTICDSMTLTGENRRLCYYGMIVLGKTRRVGLREMLRNISAKRIDSGVIGFQIGPRLNAAGRIDSAVKSLELLRATKRSEAASIAEKLEKLNEERKIKQKQAIKEIKDKGISPDPIIVVSGDWHEGILGIIAGRLLEDCKRPSFAFTEKDGVLKGSGRSFGEFSLAEALEYCKDEIISGGGHAGACGVKVEKGKIEEFKAKINEFYRDLMLFNQEEFLEEKEDLETEYVGDFTIDFIDEIKRLEPFGVGNDVPVFLLKDMFVLDSKKMGAEEQHLRLLVRDRDGATLKLVAFNAPKKWLKVNNGDKMDIWVNVEGNEWNGLRGVEGRILKMTLAREEYF